MAANSGIQLISQDSQNSIMQIVDRRLEDFHADDLSALGVEQFIHQLMSGVAPHHAGMVPAFKEIVEHAFIAGLLKVVFATETLAVGVNMPATSVVIEKTTKYNGDHHVSLNPGEFTQLTGRAVGADLTRLAMPLCCGVLLFATRRLLNWREVRPTTCGRYFAPRSTWSQISSVGAVVRKLVKC
ncbi:MAG: helicase-related protein [Ilumatobacteraceae bacterium]